jgi:hypothetical protein
MASYRVEPAEEDATELYIEASCFPHRFQLPPNRSSCWGECVNCGLQKKHGFLKKYPNGLFRCSCGNSTEVITSFYSETLGWLHLCPRHLPKLMFT